MKKRLLTMALAALFAVGTYAADYIYTTAAKFKVTGENLVTNGNFANNTEGWQSETGNPLANNWGVDPGKGPNGENVMASIAASTEAGTYLANSWKLGNGIYAISYWVKSPSTTSTTTSAGGANYINFFTNADGSATIGRQIADAVSLEAEVWTQVVDTVTVAEAEEFLVFNASGVAEGVQLTNFEIHEVTEVYDTRIAERWIAYAEQLLAEPDLASGADQCDIVGALEALKTYLQDPDMHENISLMEDFVNVSFKDELNNFMDATTVDLTTDDYFKYITDLTAFPKYNRGNIADEQVIGGFKFYGDNWLHGQDADFLNKQIQGTYPNGAGTVVLYNTSLPAGKYFVTAEMRNAYCSNSYVYTYNLESAVKARIGSEEKELGTIVGETYQKFYMIGEVKDGETFEAGFYWDGPATGSAFNIKNFEIRSFGNVMDQVAHKEAWTTFKTQYDAAANARKNIIDMQADKANYPWTQDSLQLALNQWDIYFNAVASWVTADGEDAGVASTDELTDWALYQGVEDYDINEEDGTQTRKEYQVVRGYQNAVNYVKAQNQPIADLTGAIKAAEQTRDDDMYATGNKSTFQAAIDAAQAVLTDIQTNTTDAKMEADTARISAELEKLAAAKEAFIESGTLTPIVDIDFSNGFEETEEGFTIKGVSGQMDFLASTVTTDNTVTTSYPYALGYNDIAGDVLRVGKGDGTVALPEVTDNEVLRFQFDLWVGSLTNKRWLTIQLQNAAGERVAGFSFCRYDGIEDYNDFNNEANTGLDILGYVTGVGSSSASNDAIWVDSNKSSFDLIIDYKAQAIKGSVTNGKNGTCEGGYMAIPDVSDNKIAKFVLSSTYDNADRRCWFDNLKIYKYTSQVDGPIDTGVTEMVSAKAAANSIYTISGVKVSKATQPGLYIVNGKKVVVK